MAKVVCEWGLAGVEAWLPHASVFIIVDVLSFSTAVSVAVEQGATVLPFPYGDADAAQAEATRRGAVAAAPKRALGGQLSLSPTSLRTLEPGARVLLPSPNGSRLSLETGDIPTLCGCFRNASAVANAARMIAGEGIVAVIPAGERWRDQSLRPAIEDWLGAGAIIGAMGGDPSSEASIASLAFAAARPGLDEIIRQCTSGRELIDRGFGVDVEVALGVDLTDVVPLLQNAEYRAFQSE